MRSIFGTIVLVALAFSFAPTANASYCSSNGDLMAAENCCADSGTIPVAAPDGTTFYVSTRGNEQAGPAWLYQESNNVTGLQRGGLDKAGEKQETVNGIRTPAQSETTVGSPLSGQTVGGQSVSQRQSIGQGSGMTPSAIVSVSATAPTFTFNVFGAKLTSGQTPAVSAHAWGRYDGCHDLPSAQMADLNLL